MKFIDSNIIAYAFYENKHKESCQKALEDGGITNVLALLEAEFIIEKNTSREWALRCIKGILSSQIIISDVTTSILFEAMKKVQKHTLSIYDAVHYSTAQLNECTSILSFDTDFNHREIPREQPN